MKKDNDDFNPERMLWAVIVTNIVLIVLFLLILAIISYFGHLALLN
jgi:hypothetical protein